jgi:chaperone required for assembly of F1-ATPase
MKDGWDELHEKQRKEWNAILEGRREPDSWDRLHEKQREEWDAIIKGQAS